MAFLSAFFALFRDFKSILLLFASDGHLHLFSKQNIDPYLRVRVADDEWHSAVGVGSSPAWSNQEHCFWYYDVRQCLDRRFA